MQDLCLWKREPCAESIARFGDRVVRIPTAAKPLMISLPFPKGDVCDSRQRDSDGSAAYRVVIQSQSFTRKISRLIGAVAIFKGRVTWYATSARNDEKRAESLKGRRSR